MLGLVAAAPVHGEPAAAQHSPLPPAAPTDPAPRGPVEAAIAAMLTGGEKTVAGVRVEGPLLVDLYGPRGWSPLWAGAPGAGPRIAAVIGVLRAAYAEGLDPEHYHVREIEGLAGATEPAGRAALDILLSDAVMRYGAHVHGGAYRPTQRTKDAYYPAPTADPTDYALQASTTADAAAYLATLPPRHPAYARLREELSRERSARAAGGTAEATPAPAGKAGRAAAQPAIDRVRQLEIALERLRWLPEDLGERHLWVNIPDQRLLLLEGGKAALEMPVVVGKPTWQTPAFSAEMSEVVFNPPWNVPPKIAREEVLPHVRSDGGYLKRHDMEMHGATRVVTVSEPDPDDEFAPPKTRRVVQIAGPVRIRQRPGPRNPLGRVKFNIPNGFDVYLHDTPNKAGFRAADRRLSHGCVRVADARQLATAIVEREPGGADAQKAALKGWRTRAFGLSGKIPVHIVYLTAYPGEDGAIVYLKDIYRRDAHLAARWGKPRDVRRPPQPPAAPVEPANPPAVAPAGPARQQAAAPEGPPPLGGGLPAEPAGVPVETVAVAPGAGRAASP